MEKILRPLGASYYTGTACHLDLVQWATDPTWGKLRGNFKKNLVEADLSFLQKQLSQDCIRLLLLNGSGVVNAYTKKLGCELAEKVIPGKVGWKVFLGKTERGATVVGWNKNLQSSFGVSSEYIRSVSAAIEEARVYG